METLVHTLYSRSSSSCSVTAAAIAALTVADRHSADAGTGSSRTNRNKPHSEPLAGTVGRGCRSRRVSRIQPVPAYKCPSAYTTWETAEAAPPHRGTTSEGQASHMRSCRLSLGWRAGRPQPRLLIAMSPRAVASRLGRRWSRLGKSWGKTSMASDGMGRPRDGHAPSIGNWAAHRTRVLGLGPPIGAEPPAPNLTPPLSDFPLAASKRRRSAARCRRWV